MNKKMKIKLLSTLGLVVLMALPAIAQTSISGITRTTGQAIAIQPPPSLANGRLENDTRAFVFLESENHALESPLNVDIVDPGFYDDDSDLTAATIPAGTVINSYLVHVDPSMRFAEVPLPRGINGGITFAEDIVGLIVRTSRLEDSTAELGAPRTLYQDLSGLEFTLVNLGPEDEVTFEGNRRVLRFEFRNYIEMDHMRVITSSESISRSNNNGSGSGNGNNNGNNNGSTNTDEAPNARNESVSVREDRSITIDVLDNDTDADDNLRRSSLRVTDAPSDGQTSINSSTREITYTPDNNFTGTDSFEYEVCDTTDLCDTARVTVTVTSESTTNNNNSGSGSSNRTSQGELTFRTLLPEADDCTFFDEARIDILPGNRDNVIRLDDETGYTPVAILSSEDFPAPNCVDVSTILFGPDSDADIAAISCGVINVNFDPWKDVICDFKTTDLGFSTDDTMAQLTADTIENDQIDQSGAVMVVGERRIKNFIEPRDGRNLSVAVKAQKIGKSLFVLSQGVGISTTQVQLFNTKGQLVLNARSDGALLRVNLKAPNGSALANGVYVYLVTNFDDEGNVIARTLKKIAIVR